MAKGETELMWAVKNDNIEDVRSILNSNRETINLQDTKGNTALMFAVQARNIEMVKLLLNVPELDLNLKDREGKTALIMAIFPFSHFDMVRVLVEEHERINLNERWSGCSAFDLAIVMSSETAKLFLDKKIDLNEKNISGCTPLIAAANKGSNELVNSLLAHKSVLENIDIQGPLNLTAMLAAAKNGHASVVNTLLNAGADLNATDNRGYTALDLAIENNHWEIVSILGGGNRIPINQSVIFNKFKKYIEVQQQRYGNKIYQDLDLATLFSGITGGVCSGLSGLWLYRMTQDEESQFVGFLRAISTWDETETSLRLHQNALGKIFEQMINDVRWLQDQSLMLKHIHLQRELVDIFEVTKKNKALSQEFNISFVFKHDELLETFQKIIKERKMIRVGSSNHAIGIMLVDGKYHIYDPNVPAGEIKLSTLSQLVSFLEYRFFTCFGYDKTNMSLNISVFDLSTNNPGLYKESAEEMVNTFLARNNDVNRRSWDNHTPLTFAKKMREMAIVGRILQEPNAKVNEQAGPDNHIPIISAVLSGDIEYIQLLLNRNDMDLTVRDTLGNSALLWAIGLNKIEIVKLLIEKCQNLKAKTNILNAVNNVGQTPLLRAVDERNLEVIELLLKNKEVDVNARIFGNTALMSAVMKGDVEVIRILTERPDVDLNCEDAIGFNVLFLAVLHDKIDVVNFLKTKKEIDLNARGPDGMTAFMLAALLPRTEIVKSFLQSKDIDVNIKDTAGMGGKPIVIQISSAENCSGRTALILAATMGNLDVVKMLMDYKGTELNIQDTNGNTALMTAIANGHTEIVRLLAGNDVVSLNEINQNGKNALMIATEKGNSEIIKILLDTHKVRAETQPKETENFKKVLLFQKTAKETSSTSSTKSTEKEIKPEKPSI